MRKQRKVAKEIRYVLGAMALVAMPYTLCAQEGEVTTLPDVVVTATRREKSLFDTPMSLTLVDKQSLLERADRTPSEALRYEPGIWIQKTGHLGGSPIIRGFIGNKVLYLFDGIRQNTAGSFAGPNSNLQNIDALDVDRIEVIRGPGSVLYGSDAIGGVVNVLSNEEPLFFDSPTLGGRSYLRYGSADMERSGRQEVYYSTPDLFLMGGFTAREIDDLRVGGGGKAKPSAWREHSWDVQLDYRLTPDDRIELFIQDFSRPKGTRYDRPNWIQKDDRELYGMHYFRDHLGVIDQLKLTTYYNNKKSFIDEKYWDSDSRDQSYGGEAQGTTFLDGGHVLTYGAVYHQEHITSADPQSGTEDPEVDWYNPAVFMLSEWEMNERWQLSVGLRLDHFRLRSDAPAFAQLPVPVQEAVHSGSFAMSDLNLDEGNEALTGGIGLLYRLTPEFNWVAHMGRSFRAPNKSDMLSFGQFTQGFSVPAGKIEPETSWTFETGPKIESTDFTGALTAFYTVLDHAIVQVASTFNGSDYIDVNGNGVKDDAEQVYKKANADGSLSVWGIELAAGYYVPADMASPLGGDVSFHGNLTWIEASASGDQELLGNANGSIPFNGLLGVRWENSRREAERKVWIEFDMAMVNRFDDATAADLASDPAFRRDPQVGGSPLLRADGSIPGYTVFNLRGGYRIKPNMTLTVAVNNLTDKKYRSAYSRIDEPGINAVTSLEILF